MLDEILAKNNLKYEELKEVERNTLLEMISAMNQGIMSLDKLKDYLSSMRSSVEQQLTQEEDAPLTWLSLLSYLIPLIGLIRKWYSDQKQVSLKARLKNYMMLENILIGSEKQRAAVEAAIRNIKKA